MWGGGKNLPADSRQRGMENAKGKYFTFCDSDDRFLENGLELLVNAAIINQADMVIVIKRPVERFRRIFKRAFSDVRSGYDAADAP